MSRLQTGESLITMNNLRSATESLDLKPLCCTNNNTHVPFFALRNGTYISNGTKQELIYSPFAIISSVYMDRLSVSTTLTRYVDMGSVRGVFINGTRYFTGKYLIFTFDEEFNSTVLFSAVMSKEYFRKFLKLTASLRNSYEVYAKFDKKELIFVINNAIDFDPHRGMKRRIVNYLAKTFPDNDVVYTKDMDRWGFNGVINTPKFTNVLERVEYINSLKKSLL